MALCIASQRVSWTPGLADLALHGQLEPSFWTVMGGNFKTHWAVVMDTVARGHFEWLELYWIRQFVHYAITVCPLRQVCFWRVRVWTARLASWSSLDPRCCTSRCPWYTSTPSTRQPARTRSCTSAPYTGNPVEPTSTTSAPSTLRATLGPGTGLWGEWLYCATSNEHDEWQKNSTQCSTINYKAVEVLQRQCTWSI